MKLQIYLKDPDGVYDSLESAGLDMNDLPEDVERAMDKFVEYNEYVRIEIDTENGTAIVVPL